MSGLRYYGFRYYDPLILRWNSADPLYRFAPDAGLEDPQKLNLYAFSRNNPVRWSDPDGRDVMDYVNGFKWGFTSGLLPGGALLVKSPLPDNDDFEMGRGLGLFAAGLYEISLGVAIEGGVTFFTSGIGTAAVTEFAVALVANGTISVFVGLTIVNKHTISTAGSVTTMKMEGGDAPKVAPKQQPSKSQAFRSFTADNFRENLGIRTGSTPKDAQAHHVFPQKFEAQFEKAGINIHDPRFGAWWETSAHQRTASAYNSAWESFLTSNPSAEQMLQFGREIAGRHGLVVGF